MRLFLTGNPGVGKTTLIRAIVQRLEGITCAGFYTEDTRQHGERTGFRIITLDGQKGMLATVGGKKPTVGKYSIHIEEFEKLALLQLEPGRNPADLYIIDEIGKMELLSRQFRTRIIELLAQPTNLLATITKKATPFTDQLKRRCDIELVEVTQKNRDELPGRISSENQNPTREVIPLGVTTSRPFPGAQSHARCRNGHEEHARSVKLLRQGIH